MAVQQQEHVHRLRRTDRKSEHLLLNVGRKGRKTLDLRLIGTDKNSLYVGSINDSDIQSLQERNFTGGIAEWKTVLCFALLHQRPEGTLPEFLQGVETVAAISGSTFTITLRRNIDGIIQRLGSISLEETEDEEVSTLDWVDVAAATSDELRYQLEALQLLVDSQRDQLSKLSTELDMLVKAKREHEDELLSKFAALLNAKKLKIRDQQRLLNGAKIDPVAAEEVRTARSSKASRKAEGSRSGKRKANSAAASSPEEQEDDAETVDSTDDVEGASRREQETPEPSDAATETEDEDEAALEQSATGSASQGSSQSRSQRAAQRMDIDLDEDLPPPRNLPFNSRRDPSHTVNEPNPPPTSNMNDDDEADETEDDEL